MKIYSTLIVSWVRALSIIFALGNLAGCATAADPARMTLATPPSTVGFPVKFRQSMCVRTVSGGEQTDPLWISKVSSEDFQTALSKSMQQAGLLASADPCKFPVDVNLLGLSQPTMGFDIVVTSHVNYKVFDSSGQPVLLETISAPYTATFSDAAYGVARLKMANEGSIRASITQFLEKLQRGSLPAGAEGKKGE